MGGCQSLYDEDERIAMERRKIQAKELQEFQRQLRMQKCFSELDINGKGISKKQKQKIEPTPEQIRIASNIVYDA